VVAAKEELTVDDQERSSWIELESKIERAAQGIPQSRG